MSVAVYDTATVEVVANVDGGDTGVWGWMCDECKARSRRWWHSYLEAARAAHVHDLNWHRKEGEYR